MKRIVPYIIFIILLAYLIIVFTFAATKMGEVTCRGVRVTVKDTTMNVFVGEEDILKMIKNGYGGILNQGIKTVNKDSLERILVRNPMIKSVQVYYSLDGYFHVGIEQREPVFRVLTGEGYYVDADGKVMPLSSKFTSRVIVATGNITKKFACEKLCPFVKKLRDHSFWDAYIEQIVVLQNEDIIMIPKVGDFKIILGKVDDCEERMDKLMLFLKQGIAKKGWNRYKEVNLKFKDQVVCVRK
ncbi:cell division protein FtsQ/DivIB [Gabonibacter massiliensis]|uniref:cell division protein FtsQ/DivIB n=1 Tax=Gabonibacter massiliensis TaxID=1720195 RepID=UPI00073F8886|nr:hypothetical protein [Gabonibacter massiliensis]